MTEELKLDLMKKFKELNVAEYTTKYGEYYGLMFAGAEIATKEWQNGNFILTVNEIIEGKDERIAELEVQIKKMQNCRNCKKLKKEKDGLLVCTVGSFYTNRFGENCDKWEIKEK